MKGLVPHADGLSKIPRRVKSVCLTIEQLAACSQSPLPIPSNARHSGSGLTDESCVVHSPNSLQGVRLSSRFSGRSVLPARAYLSGEN